jgi:hypothetical protein
MKWLDLEVWATTPGAGMHGYEKDAPSPPPPPDYSGIASANAEAAKMAQETATADLDFRKQVYEEGKPRQEQLATLATQVANQQMGIATTNQQHADQQWTNYQNTYQPTELASAVDAFGGQYLDKSQSDRASAILSGEAGLSSGDAERELYGLSRSAEDRAAGQASTRAEAEQNASTAQAMRAVQRMGGDPNRVATAAADLSTRQTLARVTASNAARESVRGQALGLRTGVANFGRNMPNTAGQAFGLATQAGSNATANQNAAANAGLPQAQFMAGGYGSGLAAAGIKQQGALGMGNIMANTYGSQVGAFGAQSSAATASNGQTMEMIGTVAGAAAMFF